MTDTGAQDIQAAIALLEWYGEAGVDIILTDEPRDRFAETARELEARSSRRRNLESRSAEGDKTTSAGTAGERPGRPPARQREAPQPEAGEAFPSPRIAVPDDVAIADARERARSAGTLDELREALASFEGCNLRLTAKSLVFGEGDPNASLMLVGEAPGREEDIAGVPFVGRSGQLLNRMLQAIGIERDAVRVTNTVPWRPPGNRPPTPVETEICRPFIERQIELVRPKILVCLGSPATKAILRSEEGILRVRGRWQTYSFGLGEDQSIPAMAMLHPAYLLRQPGQKRLAWRDLLTLKQRIESIAGRD